MSKKQATITIGGYNFLIVKPYHRKGEALIHSWEQMEGGSIHDIYKRPSAAKENAWRNCESMCDTLRGKRLKCGCKNTACFSAAFWIPVPKIRDNALVYRTKDHDYIVGFFD